MKTRLFKMAWSIKAQFNTFGEALAQAWKVIKLQVELCLGIVKFKYRKIDGSIRVACGTRDNLPPSKGNGKINYGVLIYFDLDVNEYRSAKLENLIF